VGLPAILGQKSTSDMLILDALYRDAAGRNGITYVDIWDGFVASTGRPTGVTPPVPLCAAVEGLGGYWAALHSSAASVPPGAQKADTAGYRAKLSAQPLRRGSGDSI